MLGGRKEMCVVTAPCVLCAVRLKHVREKRSVLLDFSYQYFVEQSRAEQSMRSSIAHAMYDVEIHWNGGIVSRFKDILSRCTFFHQPQVSIFIFSLPSLQTGCRASRQCRQNSEACSPPRFSCPPSFSRASD